MTAITEIYVGRPGTSGNFTARDIKLNPSYTFSNAISLPKDTVLYSYDPYLTVKADSTSFSSDVTLSGYLAYNWLTFHVDSLYFDLDLSLDTSMSLSAEIDAAYNTTFAYSPESLYYGLSVPGIIELGPKLSFAVEAEVAASEAVTITTGLGIEIPDGNVHLDFLHADKSTTSGWTPKYSASADISGNIQATFNPSAAVTVELALKFFGGLLDLSTGVKATPGFENEFVLTADEGIDLGGVKHTAATGVCTEGLALNSNFTFAVDVFATQFYKAELYSVVLPIVDECFSWE